MAHSVGEIGLDLVLNQNKFNSQMKGIGSLAKKVGATLAGAFVVKGLSDFTKQCLDLGSDLQEVQNVVDVAFPNMNKSINQFAQNAAAKFGLSETMAKRYTGTLGAMSQAFGFSEKEAAEMSTTLTGLAGDVASFYNISQDEAYTKLKSVFTGETESLKDLGVVMTQTALDQYALANGFGKTTAKMTEQEKVALRYQFVQSQLAKASGDFARTSDSWANQTRILSLQFDSLKATLGQGFINLFTPIIKQVNLLLGKLSTLANAFKSFTELITGKKSDNSSVKTMADDTSAISDNASDAASNVASIGDSAQKASKKLGSLAKWDELNVRTDSSDSSGSSSGSSGAGTSETDVNYGAAADVGNNAFTKLGKTMDTIKNKFLKMSKLFAKGFTIGFQSKGLDKIPGYLDNIGKKIKDIFTAPEVLSAASEWADTVVYNLGRVVGSVTSIRTSIATMLLGGVSKYFDQNSGFIKDKIVSILDISSRASEIYGNFSVAVADIFTVFEGENAQQIVADILSIFTQAFLDVTELAAKFGVDLLDTITGPIIANKDKIKKAIEKTLEPIEEFIGSVKDSFEKAGKKLNEVYDEHIHPLFQSIKDGLSEIVGTLLDGYNEHIAPVLKKLSKKFKNVFEEHINPALEKIGDLIGDVADLLKEIWEDILQPLLNWIAKKIQPIIAWLIDKIGTRLAKILSKFADKIGDIADKLSEFLKGIKKVIKKGKEAFDTLQKIIDGDFDFKATFDAVKTKAFDKISDKWNSLKNCTAIKTIKAKVKNTWDSAKKKWDSIKNSTVYKTIKGKADSTFNKMKEKWESVKNSSVVKKANGYIHSGLDKLKAKWDSLKDKTIKLGFSLKEKWSVTKQRLDELISSIKTTINKLIDGINSKLHIKWDAVKIAGKTVIPAFDKQLFKIPHLADGAVLKPNAPFLAMLGDQKHGTNIEAPLDTIKQAVREVSNEGGNNNLSADKIEVTVYVQQNDKGVFKVVKTEAKKYTDRTGKPAFS